MSRTFIYFRPLKDVPFIHRDLPAEAVPDFSHGSVLKINDVSIVVQYKMSKNEHKYIINI